MCLKALQLIMADFKGIMAATIMVLGIINTRIALCFRCLTLGALSVRAGFMFLCGGVPAISPQPPLAWKLIYSLADEFNLFSVAAP